MRTPARILRQWWQAWRQRRHIRQRVREELAFHREQIVLMLMEDGWERPAAELEAGRRLGNLRKIARQAERELRHSPHPSGEWRRQLRQIASAPGVAALLALTLSLLLASASDGLLVRQSLLRRLPFTGSNHVLVVSRQNARGELLGISRLTFERKLTMSTALDAAAYRYAYAALDDGPSTRPVVTLRSSARLFQLIGVRAELGRALQPGDRACSRFNRGRAGEVLLSHRFWQDEYGGDPAVVGQTLMLDGTSCRIIGVLPAGDWFLFPGAQVATPLDAADWAFAPKERVFTLVRSTAGESEQQLHARLEQALGPGSARLLTRPLARQVLLDLRGVVWTWAVLLTLLLAVAVRDLARAAPRATLRYFVASLWYWATALVTALALALLTATVAGYLLAWYVKASQQVAAFKSIDQSVEVFVLMMGYALLSVGVAAWCWHDHRYRCRVCLRRLRMPRQDGRWGRIFDPPETEYICLRGHGLLMVPERRLESHRPLRWSFARDFWQELLGRHDHDTAPGE